MFAHSASPPAPSRAEPGAPPDAPPRGLPPAVLAALYLALALAPLLLVLLADEPPGGSWSELGAAVGLVALALLLAQFVLSGRVETLSGRLGIDRTMRLHRETGRVLALLILVHPLALVAPVLLADPGRGAARLVALFAAPAMRSGVLAWLCVLALVAAALLRARLGLRWEAWRATHALGAATAASLATHHALARGGYSALPAVRAFWVVLLTAALLALVRTWLVKFWLMRRAGWRVAAVRRLAPDFVELELRSEHGPLPFAAGQFAWLAFGRAPPFADNPFSIASAPGPAPRLAFLIREAGDTTGAIARLATGTPVRVDGPHGAFTLAAGHAAEAGAVLFVAGGSGIAPILSLLRALDACGPAETRPLRLVHAARRTERLLCRDELAAMATRRDLRIRYRVEEGEPPPASPGCIAAVGVVDRVVLAEALDGLDPARAAAFLCGPREMMLAAAVALEDLGVPWRRIVYERFDYD